MATGWRRWPPPRRNLRDRLACTEVEEIDYFNAPIRGRAATGGVSCAVGTARLHIFARAPLGDVDDESIAYGYRQGGSLENIDRLVGTGDVGSPECQAWMLVAESWFILADRETALADAEEVLGGGAIRSIAPVSPPASYDPPGCRTAA